MKQLIKTFTCFLGIIVVFLFSSCKKDILTSKDDSEMAAVSSHVQIPGAEVPDSYNTFYGPVVQMGNGHARTWINVSQDNRALAFGVELTDGALEDLPDIPEEERDFISGPADFLLVLHPKARELTPYDHICINWNEHGHEPAGIYNLPHFD
ncbi:MAG: hypothetical protein EPN92_00220, partial [Chitinophagaceae bacterium]